MTSSLKLAAAIATVGVLLAAIPHALADGYFVPLDGLDKNIPAACGYRLFTSKVGGKVVVEILLNENASKAFLSAELTLKAGAKTVLETRVGLQLVDNNKAGLLKLTLDPQVIDGGEMTISSAEIKDGVPLKNFAGFRLSIEKVLELAKAPQGK